MSDTTEIRFEPDGKWTLNDIVPPNAERAKGDLIPDLIMQLNGGAGLSPNVQWLDAVNITGRDGALIWRLVNARRATGRPDWTYE